MGTYASLAICWNYLKLKSWPVCVLQGAPSTTTTCLLPGVGVPKEQCGLGHLQGTLVTPGHAAPWWARLVWPGSQREGSIGHALQAGWGRAHVEVGAKKGEGRREQEKLGLPSPSIQGPVLGWNPPGPGGAHNLELQGPLGPRPCQAEIWAEVCPLQSQRLKP